MGGIDVLLFGLIIDFKVDHLSIEKREFAAMWSRRVGLTGYPGSNTPSRSEVVQNI